MPKFTSVMRSSGDDENVTVAIVFGPLATRRIADLICTGAALNLEVADGEDVSDLDFDDMHIHHIATFAGAPTAVLSTGSGPGWLGQAIEVKVGSPRAKALVALAEAYAAAQDDTDADEGADGRGDDDLGAGAEPVCRLSEGDHSAHCG